MYIVDLSCVNWFWSRVWIAIILQEWLHTGLTWYFYFNNSTGLCDPRLWWDYNQWLGCVLSRRHHGPTPGVPWRCQAWKCYCKYFFMSLVRDWIDRRNLCITEVRSAVISWVAFEWRICKWQLKSVSDLSGVRYRGLPMGTIALFDSDQTHYYDLFTYTYLLT